MALDESLLKAVNSYAETIRSLAGTVASNSSIENDLRRSAAHRVSRPIDYMRYAEFGAVLARLQLQPGSLVLDAGGPQWLTFALAAKHPQVQFQYVNFADYELQPFEKIRTLLQLDNLVISKEDLRQLSFSDNQFDEIFSISVLEHIFPEEGGDIVALRELKRVLKQGGSLVITTPCKDKPNVVYVQGGVYERNSPTNEKQFYAREYSAPSLKALIGHADFTDTEIAYISESPSLASIDYLEWGPLRGNPFAGLLLKFFRRLERFSGIPVERILASSKLSVVTTEMPRLVNAVVKMQKSVAA
ncbi:class I SAM-dependent methyltransferase [Thiobacillus sp.]|uniref:class I SAM-dependent methyltransferase n=1 Tax=Thiobacillus sp. TaxID=924 RepID=UPI0025E50F11|nr:class I SAM-dependent methyltransferase [Thiobacillus sp.]MBT9538262.1 methyltransferase domain-containing protein [Thiobacillus sp.]